MVSPQVRSRSRKGPCLIVTGGGGVDNSDKRKIPPSLNGVTQKCEACCVDDTDCCCSAATRLLNPSNRGFAGNPRLRARQGCSPPPAMHDGRRPICNPSR